jgi:hypothetical protein
MVAGVELPINESASAIAMANEIFGAGATVVGASYSGWSQSSGIFSNGDTISPGVTPSDTGVILSTGRASDFANPGSQSNVRSNTSTNTPGVNNDPQFNALAGASTYDASILTVDFIPTGNVMSFQFIYASEEYPEYVNTTFNDTVGVWVNGVHVPVAVGSGTSNISNVNQNNNINLYNDNTSDQFNTEMDGFTVTMTLTIPVNPGVVNTLRIGIADVADANYDSNLLIAGDSVQDSILLSDDAYDVVQNGTPTLDILANDVNSGPGALTITHINGTAVNVGDTVTLATGQQVTLNADGTFGLVNDLDLDTITFTYTAENGAGTTDTAFVEITTIPCFVSGTKIDTPDGPRDVETLEAGDLVNTLDDGPQQVRWIGRRRVTAQGIMAPVHIAANTFGDHDDIWLSPQHRVLIRDNWAELLFGEREVLVAAKDLINDSTVTRDEAKTEVEYVHILFDRHQVVFSAGLATESFLPGPQTLHSFESEIMDEICRIFPEIDPETGYGYSPAARTELKAYEAQLLLTQSRAA